MVVSQVVSGEERAMSECADFMIPKPVFDAAGDFVCYDIYFNDIWIGSRRTMDQVTQEFRNRIWRKDEDGSSDKHSNQRRKDRR